MSRKGLNRLSKAFAKMQVADVLICDNCLMASCAKGQMFCEDAQTAGYRLVSRAELVKMRTGEHPSNWEEKIQHGRKM